MSSTVIAPATWIDVTERLPDDEVPVLVFTLGEDLPKIAQLHEGRWLLFDTDMGIFQFDVNPTHWMPLPGPPGA